MVSYAIASKQLTLTTDDGGTLVYKTATEAAGRPVRSVRIRGAARIGVRRTDTGGEMLDRLIHPPMTPDQFQEPRWARFLFASTPPHGCGW